MAADPIKRDLARLIEQGRKQNRLAESATPPAIGVGVGLSVPKSPKGQGAGGIAGPLTVQAMSGTSSLQMVSTDGFFVLNLPLTVDLVDGNGGAFQVKFPT